MQADRFAEVEHRLKAANKQHESAQEQLKKLSAELDHLKNENEKLRQAASLPVDNSQSYRAFTWLLELTFLRDSLLSAGSNSRVNDVELTKTSAQTLLEVGCLKVSSTICRKLMRFMLR